MPHRNLPAIAVSLLLSTLSLPGQRAAEGAAARAGSPADPPLYVRAGRVLTMDGPTLFDAAVLVENGKIRAIGEDLQPPAGAIVREYPDGVLMPGFVELHCHVGVPRGDINDTVLPHNMELRTLDLVMQNNIDLSDALEAGITTVLIIPGSGSTIGGLGTIVKTAGPSMEQRLVRYPGALKIALHARGGNPARRSGDLGSGRLGLHTMLKEILGQAKDYHESWTAFEAGTASKPEFNPRLDELRGLWKGEFPIIFHAYGVNDTMTAVRVAKWQFDAPMIISHGVYDSFKIADQLAASGVPMNIGPRQYEFDESRFIGNAAPLHAAGVPTSICTDAPVVAQDQLQLQAAMAVRLGLPAEAALRGLTIENAKAAFLDDRVGTLTVGKDGDLVVFPGDPLDPRNAPELVVIEGRIQHQRSPR